MLAVFCDLKVAFMFFGLKKKKKVAVMFNHGSGGLVNRIFQPQW